MQPFSVSADRASRNATFVPEPVAGGRRFGELEIIGKLGEGGMATVYLCHRAAQAGFRRLFAVKVLHPHLASQEAFVQMLIDEARIAAHLHHPHAVPIIDIRQESGTHYLVMDYVEGCSLSDILRLRPVEQRYRLVARVLVDALNGLHAAHWVSDEDDQPLGLVHRDVSPQNILIGTDGNARITDFGIAKARARITLTEPSVVKGKFNYLAPEQLSHPDDIDHRVDVFAAGTVLWTSLTGLHLFQGGAEQETIRNVVAKEVPLPSSVGLRPPRCFDAVCLRALERDPARRYQTSAEMASELRAAAIGAGCLASPFEVADWVRMCFSAELLVRHQAIREHCVHDVTHEPIERRSISGPTPTPAASSVAAVPVLQPRKSRVITYGPAAVAFALTAAAAVIAGSRWSSSDRGRAAGSPAPNPTSPGALALTMRAPAQPGPPSPSAVSQAQASNQEEAPPIASTSRVGEAPRPRERRQREERRPSPPPVVSAPLDPPHKPAPIEVESNPYLR